MGTHARDRPVINISIQCLGTALPHPPHQNQTSHPPAPPTARRPTARRATRPTARRATPPVAQPVTRSTARPVIRRAAWARRRAWPALPRPPMVLAPSQVTLRAGGEDAGTGG